ncbi:hypothetical protein ACKWTF_014532 [Chironomus riparius]
MSRKGRNKKNPNDEIEAMRKIFCDEASNQMKMRNFAKAVIGYNQAIEMSPNDQGALIARSKCYLQLGEPEKALLDAETALEIDKNSIRAIYQKAEALYYLGKFEHSLMFFHRGLRLRPELNNFRLGVQKTQEAIENTIGGCQHKLEPRQLAALQKSDKHPPIPRSLSPASSTNTRKTPKAPISREVYERRQSRKLLGELFVDKEYLENLLKHPDLKRADTKTENVSGYAKDAIAFLNNRQEFWRQQKPTNILSSGKAIHETIPQMSANTAWRI